MPSGSLASYEHGDVTNSNGHLSRYTTATLWQSEYNFNPFLTDRRQPGVRLNISDHQSPLYLMWKLPTTDNPPPYTETAERSTAAPPEEEQQETTGLLSVPSAPLPQDLDGEPTMLVLGNGTSTISVLVRRSNGTLDSEFLDAGTPPPSYAEVLASISNPAVDQIMTQEQDPELGLEPSGKCSILFYTANI